MKAVGIKQLKSRLSEYVRLAKTGETILVTERDQVVAELRPARRREPPPAGVEEALDVLAEQREVTRARLSKQGWSWKMAGLGLPEGTARQLLDDLRVDRDA